VKIASKSISVSGPSTSSDSGSLVVASLKQKVHALEQILRKKEDNIKDFKKSTGNTQVNEMKVEMEVYLAEIERYVICIWNQPKQAGHSCVMWPSKSYFSLYRMCIFHLSSAMYDL